jgi:hypothetical protein
MSDFALNILARLALKNHQEMQALLGTPRSGPKSPLEWALSLGGSNTGMSLHSDAKNGVLFKFTQGPRSYQVQIPANAQNLDDAAILLKLEKVGRAAQTCSVTGAQLAQLKLSDEFVELHKTAMAHLKQFYSMGTQPKTDDSKASAPSLNEATNSPSEPADSPAQEAAPTPEFSDHLVVRDNLPNLKFKGKLLASVCTAPRNGRQRVYSVYESESGKKIGVKKGVSYWLGERDMAEASVFESTDDLLKFFGYDTLAKFLYQELSLVEHAEELVP